MDTDEEIKLLQGSGSDRDPSHLSSANVNNVYIPEHAHTSSSCLHKENNTIFTVNFILYFVHHHGL